jgi:tyrosyl-tRNA synthetase
MFEKCMKVPDQLLGEYFRLTTELDMREVAPLLDKDIREGHFLYAGTIVAMYWGAEDAKAAKDRYQTVASGAAPESMAEYRLAADTYPLWKLVMLTGLADTSSNARRLIQQGGLTVDGAVYRDPVMELACEGELLLKRGKSSFARAIFG